MDWTPFPWAAADALNVAAIGGPFDPLTPGQFVAAPPLEQVRAGETILQRWHTGPAVGHVQRLLGINADDFFGEDTERAVAAAQARLGLQIDPGFIGKVGRQTLTALEQQAPQPVPTPVGLGPGFDPRNQLGTVHPELRRRMLAVGTALAARGMQMQVHEGLRSFERQEQLFREGRRLVNGEWRCTRPGCPDIVTSVRGGFSNHNYGLAVDCYPFLAGRIRFSAGGTPASVRAQFAPIQNAIGIEGERLGLTWGGRWTQPHDPPHLQLFPLNVLPPRECLQIYQAAGNNLQAVWDAATRVLGG